MIARGGPAVRAGADHDNSQVAPPQRAIRVWRSCWAHPLPAILVAACLIRAALIVATPHFVLSGDAVDYHNHSASIAAGYGYPTTQLATPGTPSAFRPPGYPFLLGGTYALLGTSVTVGRLLSLLLGVLCVGLIHAIARALWNRRIAVIAAATAAVFPPMVALSASLLSEALFLPLELALCLTLARAISRPRIRWWLLAGGLCAAAALTRSVADAWIVVAMAVALTRPQRWRSRGRSVLALAVAFALTLAPWMIRNAVAFHAFVPISTEAGFTLVGQYNDETATDPNLPYVWHDPRGVPGVQRLLPTDLKHPINEQHLNVVLTKTGVRYLRAHPQHLLHAIWFDSLRMLDLGRAHTFTSNLAYNVLGLPVSLRFLTTLSAQILFLLAALVTAIWLARRRRLILGPWWFWALAALTFAATVPEVGNLLKRAPLDPFVILLVAAGIGSLHVRSASPRETTRLRG